MLHEKQSHSTNTHIHWVYIMARNTWLYEVYIRVCVCMCVCDMPGVDHYEEN